jgi:hypothetical protein
MFWYASGRAALVAVCVAVVAGCAAAHTAGPGTTASPGAASLGAASPTGASPGAGSPGAGSGGPRERAVAEAAALLRAFVVPPGGQRLATAPDALKDPITILVSTTLVEDTSFWRAPGQPEAILAWEQAHLPHRFTPEDADFGPPAWDRMFSLTPIPGVLNNRDLVVEVTGAGNGQTAIRVDAQVSWQPPRPAAERVPADARVVTITQVAGPDPNAVRPPAPVTITDLGVVRRLAALVDGLGLSTIGPAASCPMVAGDEIRLTFLARTGGPPLAVAQAPAVCGTVQFSAGGKPQPALQITDSFVAQVLKLAGLHWKVM